MSQRNSETDGMAVALAFIGVAFALVFMFLYAIACFVAIILTIVALCAWNGLSIGTWRIEAHEARGFVACGVAGAITLSLFIIFSAALFQLQIKPDWWGYILLGGYSLGALGGSAAMAEQGQTQEAAKFITGTGSLPLAEPLPAGRHRSQLYDEPVAAEPQKPFKFASWDDEMPDDNNPSSTGSTSKPMPGNDTGARPRADDGSDCPHCPCHWTQEDIDRIVAEIKDELSRRQP